MRVFGLTGGIGSGKSTVAALFEEAGVPVVDADRIAREVVEPGSAAHGEIVARFGKEVLLPDGGIDRRKLGAIVFSDPARRAELEAITIPRIREGIEEALAKLDSGGHPAAVVEAALLIENGRTERFDAVICVHCDRQTQLRRIASRGDLTPAEAGKRIEAQMPSDEKARLSDHVIDNSGSPEETRRSFLDLLFRLGLSKAPPPGRKPG
jgi:dephospho-CoA kinase